MSKTAIELAKEYANEMYPLSGNETEKELGIIGRDRIHLEIAFNAGFKAASQLQQQERDIQCKCSREEKTGYVQINCCNLCGLPEEEWWTQSPNTK
jgi:hypothetical protein